MVSTAANYRFAERMKQTRSSTIREMLKTATRPDIIPFAAGLPAPELFDIEGIRSAGLDALLRPTLSLQYGVTDGELALRQELVKLTNKRGAMVELDTLLVTSGSQQGIDLITRVMIDPGDVVLVERPSYLAAIQNFELAQARIVDIESAVDGPDIDALEKLFKTKPKMLYLVPTFANPSGDTISLKKRQRILELAVEYEVLVVEDDPYGELVFNNEEVIPPMLAVADKVPGARDWCVYLSTMSKILAPGLRIAWMVAPPAVHDQVVVAKQASDLCSSTYAQQLGASYLAAGYLSKHLNMICQTYKERSLVLVNALREHLTDAIEFEAPKGGMFIWVKVKGQNTAELITKALERGVSFVPGAPFFAHNPEHGYMRLCFATATKAQIEEGVRRLASAILE